MYSIIFQSLEASWNILKEASLYLLLGFVVAGIIRGCVSAELVEKYLRKGRFKSVFYASMLGIPIPLCSCGVVPAVAGFRRQGANKGSCLSFLISTPETGIDSIALTYSLLGPIMSVMRPIAAFVTAMCAGLVENFAGNSRTDGPESIDSLPRAGRECCCSDGCSQDVGKGKTGFIERLKLGLSFTVNDLLYDLAPWLAAGILLAGVVTAVIPDSLVNLALGHGFVSYIVALVISAPMYVCATMSTPIAAALVIKGMSPGAAMVLLMAGPATNIATIVMVTGLLGKRSAVIYLGSIVICSLVMAFITDGIIGNPHFIASGSHAEEFGFMEPLQWVGAFALIILVLRSLWTRYGIQNAKAPSGPDGLSTELTGVTSSCACGSCGKNDNNQLP